MHHQPDIRLVDPHAESVGRGDDPQLADAKSFLDVALFLGRQPGVEPFRRQTLLLEEIGEALRLAAGGAIDYGTRSAILWQFGLDFIEYIGQLGAALRGPDLKAEISAHGPAVQQHQFALKT
jgi:hypothetical protein